MADPIAPKGVEGAALALAAFMVKAPPPVRAAWKPFVVALAQWADQIAEADIADAVGRVLGGFLGSIAAPGIKASVRALINQLAADAQAGD
jgi:hypothetical protein